jgi:hypothetical protein
VTVSLGVSWANRGRTQDFIHSQTTTATVNGTASNVSSDWMSPTRITGGYVSWLYVPVGTLANAGDSVVVQLQINVRHKIPSGKDPLTGKQLFTGPGDLLGPGTSCTITAV